MKNHGETNGNKKNQNIAMLLKGALAAENMVGLKMNLRRKTCENSGSVAGSKQADAC